jgi:hypothetical protein
MPAMLFRYGMEEHRGHGALLRVDKPEARRTRASGFLMS